MNNPYAFLDADPVTDFEFESAARSVQLAAEACVAVPLLHWRPIRVSGEERKSFLHRLVSNDVEKLPADGVQWNSLNNPKGRMIASFLLWNEPDSLLLAPSADLHPEVSRRLAMYVLRSKVRIEDAGGELALIGVGGAGAEAAVRAAGLAVPGERMCSCAGVQGRTLRLDADTFVIGVPAAGAAGTWQALVDAGARPAGTSAWDLLQIRAGVPRVGNLVREEFVAQMLNFELIGGVSFTKGCYPGQEIVARTQYLGKLKKRMYRGHCAGGPLGAGQHLFAPAFGEQSVGKVVMATPAPEGGWECLAVLQSSCAEDGTLSVGRPGGEALRILPLPYVVT